MNKREKTIITAFFIFVVLFIKAVTVYKAFFPDSPVHVNGFSEITDAILSFIFYIFLVFAFFSKKNSGPLKTVCACVLPVVFMAVMTVENYLLQFITYNSFFKWDNPCPYLVFFRKGIEAYFRTGRPPYHFAVLTVVAVTLFVIFIFNIKDFLLRTYRLYTDTRDGVLYSIEPDPTEGLE